MTFQHQIWKTYSFHELSIRLFHIFLLYIFSCRSLDKSSETAPALEHLTPPLTSSKTHFYDTFIVRVVFLFPHTLPYPYLPVNHIQLFLYRHVLVTTILQLLLSALSSQPSVSTLLSIVITLARISSSCVHPIFRRHDV